MENLPSTNSKDQECHEVLESVITCYGCLKLKKCGVRIVYQKDLEEIEEIKDQSSDGLALNNGAVVKRKRYMYEEAGTMCESSDNAEETPQPKRLEKIINFIMRKKD
ncbi:hypothetical protein PTKIN_Ptkin14bG0134700 [Pterospermum kingtungense]